MKTLHFALKSSLTFLIGMAVLSSCQKETISPISGSGKTDNAQTFKAPFEFIKVGNEWSYNMTAVGADQNNQVTVNGTVISKVNSYLGNGDFKGETSSTIGMSGEPQVPNGKDNFSWHSDETSWTDENGTILHVNPSAGQTYFTISDNHDTLFSKVISTEEIVTVPAGEFACVKIHYYSSNKEGGLSGDSYYSLKFGLIKNVTNIGFSETKMNFTTVLTHKNF